jgi:hypothetical protein
MANLVTKPGNIRDVSALISDRRLNVLSPGFIRFPLRAATKKCRGGTNPLRSALHDRMRYTLGHLLTGLNVRNYRHVSVLAIAALCTFQSKAQLACGPRDPSVVVAQVVQHELHAAPSQGRWMYTATYTKDGVRYVARKIETDDGILASVISRDGTLLSNSEKASQQSSIRSLVANPDFLQHNRKAMTDDDAKINALLAALPTSIQFDCLVQSGELATVDFHPKDGYSPWGVEERIIAGMSGTLQLDLNEMRLRAASGATQTDLSLLLGLGRIYKGSSVSLRRTRVATGTWETTSVSTHIKGQLFFLKTIGQDDDESRSDYCPVPKGLSAQDALPYLDKPNCPAN